MTARVNMKDSLGALTAEKKGAAQEACFHTRHLRQAVMNWLAILCAGVAYWVLGFVWYSLLFGKILAAEMKGYRGERAMPGAREMGANLVGTFVCNLVAAGAMAYLFHHGGIIDLNYAIRLGLIIGIGFAGTALTMNSIWESKPTKVWAIDAGYNVVGALLLAIILVSWP
jgi:hypothetical protein